MLINKIETNVGYELPSKYSEALSSIGYVHAMTVGAFQPGGCPSYHKISMIPMQVHSLMM